MSLPDRIRNFSIIAHIDHGKSTLADRLIQMCGGLSDREMDEQVLDSMDIERERGITIKSQSVTLQYTADDGLDYELNFIDTPGHVDFSYEVSRSLAACEGALLVVDAAQGVEAQSVATCYTAIDQGLEVIPVLNKMDLPQADPKRTRTEIEDIIGLPTDGTLEVSAKTGTGIHELVQQIVTSVPPPKSTGDALQALIVDSWFDRYLGVVSLVRVFGGQIKPGDEIVVHSLGREHSVDEVGVFTPRRERRDVLQAGQVGYVVAGIKDIHGAPVGDTLQLARRPCDPLPGFKQVTPKVYAGIYPVNTDHLNSLRTALEKLCLNDSSLRYEMESSDSMGFGFRCGFLGLLHLEIVQERLEREYDLDLITSAPTVVYEIVTRDGEVSKLQNPSELPPVDQMSEIREPIASVNILVPQDYVGNVLELCEERRGAQQSMHFSGDHVSINYEIPMAEVIVNFFDRLKSVSRGFASLDYSFSRFEQAPLVRLDMLINGEPVESMATIVHRDIAQRRGRMLTEVMKEEIPRQLFDVAIQAAIGRQVIARSTVKALRKNVTAKCYGGDVTRKRKLLEKQKAGKKRMKQVGKVQIPQSAFFAVVSAQQ